MQINFNNLSIIYYAHNISNALLALLNHSYSNGHYQYPCRYKSPTSYIHFSDLKLLQIKNYFSLPMLCKFMKESFNFGIYGYRYRTHFSIV